MDFEDLWEGFDFQKHKKRLYRLQREIKRHTWVKILATDTNYMGIRPYKSKWKNTGKEFKIEDDSCLNINKHISIYSSLVFGSISMNRTIHFQAYSDLVVGVFQNRFMFRFFTFPKW